MTGRGAGGGRSKGHVPLYYRTVVGSVFRSFFWLLVDLLRNAEGEPLYSYGRCVDVAVVDLLSYVCMLLARSTHRRCSCSRHMTVDLHCTAVL